MIHAGCIGGGRHPLAKLQVLREIDLAANEQSVLPYVISCGRAVLRHWWVRHTLQLMVLGLGGPLRRGRKGMRISILGSTVRISRATSIHLSKFIFRSFTFASGYRFDGLVVTTVNPSLGVVTFGFKPEGRLARRELDGLD